MGNALLLHKIADYSDGERVTAFVKDASAPGGLRLSTIVDPASVKEIAEGVSVGEEKPWPLAGVELRGEPPPEWHVTPDFVTQGVVEGWILPSENQIVLKLQGGDVTYTIIAPPGEYPDPDEPSGRRRDNFYRCELVS